MAWPYSPKRRSPPPEQQEFRGDRSQPDASYEPTYRPQALYNRANEGFHANNETFLLHEVATNLPIYLPDTGPHRFPSSPPAGRLPARAGHVGYVHLRLRWPVLRRWPWCGDAAERDRSSPALLHLVGVVHRGESKKRRRPWCRIRFPWAIPASFWRASLPIPRPSPTRRWWVRITSTNRKRHVWPGATLYMIAHPMPVSGCRIRWSWKRSTGRCRPLRRSNPPGRFTCAISESRFRAVVSQPGHIIATDPRGQSLLPKSASATADTAFLDKGEVVIYRVIRGTAEFKNSAGENFELATGDTVTAGKNAINLVAVGENTQILRLGLLKGMENLRGWTPTQRDEIDGLAGSDHYAEGHSSAAYRRKAGRVFVRVSTGPGDAVEIARARD